MPVAVRLLWPSVHTPSGEVAAVKNVYAHLEGLRHSVLAWKASLRLYQTGNHPPPSIAPDVARRWRFIACNECVLELYHLRARLQRIHTVLLAACPSILRFVDVSRLKSARKRLEEDFPHAEALRHATAHRGEIEAFPADHAPDGAFALSGFREPNIYSLYYKGQLRYLEITEESLNKITSLVQEFLDAFDYAAAELQRQGHAE